MTDDLVDLTEVEKLIIHWALDRAETEFGFELSEKGGTALESARRAVPCPEHDRYWNGLRSRNP